MPQAFVRGHKALDVATTMVVGLHGAPGEYGFEDVQQVRGTLQIGRVTRVMESDQHFVRQSPAVPWKVIGRDATCDLIIQRRSRAVPVLLRHSVHVPPRLPIYRR